MGPPLDGRTLREAMARYLEALRNHRQEIDSLNVFPVPDEDTGTNMLLTQQAVDGAVRDLREASLAEVGDAVFRAGPMGARGNSGVILSQVLRGLYGDGLDELDRVGEAFAEAFPSLEVEVHRGGQPNNPLLIGLE